MSVAYFSDQHIQTVLNTGAVVEYCAVKRGTTENGKPKALAAGLGDDAWGIACEDGASARTDQPIATRGPGRVKVNAATINIVAGDYLKPGTSTGILIKANDGDKYIAIAEGPASTDGAIIDATLEHGVCSIPNSTAITISATPATLTAAQLNGKETTLNVTVASPTINLPTGSELKGRRIRTNRLTSATTITLDPAGSETIGGSANNTELDAIGDFSIHEYDGVSNWFLVAKIVA